MSRIAEVIIVVVLIFFVGIGVVVIFPEGSASANPPATPPAATGGQGQTPPPPPAATAQGATAQGATTAPAATAQGVTLPGFQAPLRAPARGLYQLAVNQCVGNGSIRVTRIDEMADANGNCTWVGQLPEEGGCFYSAAEPSGATFTLRVGTCPAEHDRVNVGAPNPDVCGESGAAENVTECQRLFREFGSGASHTHAHSSGQTARR